jgi:hypothetical protein
MANDRDPAQAAFEAAVGIGVDYLARLAREIWHKMNACSCDRGYFVDGIPCEIGREEIAAWKAARLFAEWDALGLGYIGPRLERS